MKWIFKVMIMTLLLMGSQISYAEVQSISSSDAAENTYEIKKENLLALKILGTDFDRIFFMLIEKNTQKRFKFSTLSFQEADHLLSQLKKDQTISVVYTKPNQSDYLDVSTWR
jgi:hypothetical protein